MEIVEQLTRLGVDMTMTEYEAKVYVALLTDYPSTGYQLSKQAGIPRSMVYEALGRLEVRGAVLKTEEEKSTLYRPVPPEVLLDRYQSDTDRRIALLREQLVPRYEKRADGRVWNFSGNLETLHIFATEMISKASRELMLVLTDADLPPLAQPLREAHQRGVKLGVLLTGQGEFALGEVVRHPTHETELHHMEQTLVVVADEAEVLIASGHRQSAATLTSNPNLVQITRQFVWMELFSQRIFARLGNELLERLEPEDRRVLC